MLLQIETTRLFLIFGIGAILIVFFSFMSYRILSYKKAKLNIYISLFFIFILIGAILNILYAIIQIEPIPLALHLVTNFIVSFALIFLLVANKIIIESEMRFGTKKQLKVMLRYGVILALMLVFVPFGQVTINTATNWRPVWGIFYFLYITVIVIIFAVIPTILSSINILREFSKGEAKSKYAFFIIGTFGEYSYLFSAFFNNFLDNDAFRQFASIYALSIILWCFLVYYGIGRQLKD